MSKRSATGLRSLSVPELQHELRRRQRRLPALQRRRDRFAQRLAAIDDQISALDGSATSGRGARGAAGHRTYARNEMTLVDALSQVLKGKTMRVPEAVEAVKKAGYQTSATPLGFRTMVNITLGKKDRFKRVARGQYTAK
jgi:hypothetical protein